MPRTLSGQRSSFLVCRNWLAIVLVTVTRSVLVPTVAAPFRSSRNGSPRAPTQGDAVQGDFRGRPHTWPRSSVDARAASGPLS